MKNIKEIEVRYSETDQMGVVYHANYLVWLELGRTKFFSDLGYTITTCEEKGIMFPIREVNIKYLTPCRYGENIIVETSVHDYSKVRTIYKQVVKNDLDEIKAEALVTVVCVDSKSFKLIRLDQFDPNIHNIYLSFNKN